MSEMPLVTRNYESLMNLQPGVAFGGATDHLTRGPSGLSGASSTVAFSVNGGRTTSNGWTIDGADNLDRGANLTLYTYPSPDAIAEFKTLRGQYSAQFGRNASGQIDVVTKSGTNHVHGSAYEYARNDDFDANGYANDFLGSKSSPYHYNVLVSRSAAPSTSQRSTTAKQDLLLCLRGVAAHHSTRSRSPRPQCPSPQRSRATSLSPALTTPGGVKTWTLSPVTVCTAYTTNTATQKNTCTATGTQVTSFSPTAQQYLKDVYSKIPAPDPVYDIAHI
jgi:hypothetical protein